MTDAIAFISIGTLCVGVVILAVAFLGMRSARRSAELAEHRMEYLREEHDRLVFLREERQSLEEELKRERSEREQERQARRKAEQKADYLEEECKKLREAKKSGQLDRERIIEDLREASRTLWKRLSPPR